MSYKQIKTSLHNTVQLKPVGRGFITYTCTNHPEIILNEPGNCPECGKVLVKKY